MNAGDKVDQLRDESDSFHLLPQTTDRFLMF